MNILLFFHSRNHTKDLLSTGDKGHCCAGISESVIGNLENWNQGFKIEQLKDLSSLGAMHKLY